MLHSCVWHHNCSVVYLFYISSFIGFQRFTSFYRNHQRHLHCTNKWLPQCSCLLCCYLLNADNGPSPTASTLRSAYSSSGACRVARISRNHLFSASSLTRKFSFIWRKHFLSASWRSSVWVVYCRSGWWCVCVCACACGVVYSCGSSIRGDSILIAQQLKEWREWGKNEWKLIGICCILGIICSLLWTGVFCSGRCVPFQESTAQGVE